MRFLTALNIAVGIGAAIFFASLAPPAYADPNPYHPAPIAVSETPDHGKGTYCSKPFLLGTCEAPMLINGDGVQPTIHYTPKPSPAPAPKP